VHHSIDLFQ